MTITMDVGERKDDDDDDDDEINKVCN